MPNAIPYGQAARLARYCGLSAQFQAEYGPRESWIDPDSGEAIPVDSGELRAWLDSHA